MIARVGFFEDSPERFSGGGYAWTKEAVENVPGFRGLFHLAGRDGVNRSLSISLWESEDAAKAGEASVGAKRAELDVSPAPPTLVETFDVVDYK